MGILQTAERVSQTDLSDNYVYQRSMLAYVYAAGVVSGKVLEIGTGSGYGIELIAKHAEKFVTVDKFETEILSNKDIMKPNVEFIKMNIPPLSGLETESFDYVISFQVIEHIQDDLEYLKEIHRVLKKGGKFICATPNIKTSITRNPWHIREYTIEQLKTLFLKVFGAVDTLGVFGKGPVLEYYEQNKISVAKITRFDIFNLQYRLPRFLLQIPFDILNRYNRKKMLNNDNALVKSIGMEHYFIDIASDTCFDLYFIGTK